MEESRKKRSEHGFREGRRSVDNDVDETFTSRSIVRRKSLFDFFDEFGEASGATLGDTFTESFSGTSTFSRGVGTNEKSESPTDDLENTFIRNGMSDGSHGLGSSSANTRRRILNDLLKLGQEVIGISIERTFFRDKFDERTSDLRSLTTNDRVVFTKTTENDRSENGERSRIDTSEETSVQESIEGIFSFMSRVSHGFKKNFNMILDFGVGNDTSNTTESVIGSTRDGGIGITESINNVSHDGGESGDELFGRTEGGVTNKVESRSTFLTLSFICEGVNQTRNELMKTSFGEISHEGLGGVVSTFRNLFVLFTNTVNQHGSQSQGVRFEDFTDDITAAFEKNHGSNSLLLTIARS